MGFYGVYPLRPVPSLFNSLKNLLFARSATPTLAADGVLMRLSREIRVQDRLTGDVSVIGLLAVAARDVCKITIQLQTTSPARLGGT